MHKPIVALGIAMTCLQVGAQENFQGRVVFSMSSSSAKELIPVEVLYGDQLIKVLVKSDGQQASAQDDLIFDFKKGILYKIKNHNKSYRVDSLGKGYANSFLSPTRHVAIPANDTVLLGYPCKAYTLPESQTDITSGNMKVTFWYTDSLVYKVPAEYMYTDPVAIVTNGRAVGFGLTYTAGAGNQEEYTRMSVVSVDRKTVPLDSLALPPGYTSGQAMAPFNDDTPMAVDTVASPDMTGQPATGEPKKSRQKNRPGGRKTTEHNPKSPVRKPDN
jgi:hypothetical protein